MFKNLIFDWSGTLVDDLALTLDASNYVFSQYGKPCMDRDEFRAEFQLPYPDYYARVLPQCLFLSAPPRHCARARIS